jgi:hypothetical protein
MDAEQAALYRKLGYQGPLAVRDEEAALSFAPPEGATAPEPPDAFELGREAAELALYQQ